jgi:hypothetical protein
MKKQQTNPRAQLTLAQLLKQDQLKGPRMPIEVRDWLARFVAGTKLPPVSINSNNPECYREVAWVCAVLDDKYVTTTGDKGLPHAAVAIVEKYLRELEEETNIHIWNQGQVARTALPIMLDGPVRGDDSHTIAVIRAAFALHCTRKQVSDFLTRSGLRESRYSDSKWEKQDLAKPRDYDAATAAAHILGDSKISSAARDELGQAITELGNSTRVFTHHPALVELALQIMFESMSEPIPGKRKKLLTGVRQKDYDRVHATVKRLNNKKRKK